MPTIRTVLASALFAACAITVQPSVANDAPMTKEQATETALKAHPGEVLKAYQETKKGKKVWEVQIKGADGKQWQVFYDVKTGQFVEDKEAS